MRKILSILAIAVLVVFNSCDKNEKPEFSDSDAFVSFDRAALSVKENVATLSIPVTLASVKGISTTVTYSVVNGTAVEGTNFTLADGSATLTFDAANRTQNIVINIIDNPGVFTGDLKFQIKLSSDGTIKPSKESVCTVTINDVDHPLAAFLGTWTATADSYYYGDAQTWTVTLEKDANDVTVLWIQNVVYGFPKWGFTYPTYDTRFYCTVNDAKNAILIPIGQKCKYQYEGNDIFLVGLDASLNTIESGNITGTVSADGKTITFDRGIYVYDETAWDAIFPGMTWTKN